jgi:putative CocE/NonD family hydrolase
MRAAVETDVVITMRDGCRLYADVFRPDDGAQHPVLVHVTYVNKRSRHGLALIINPIAAVERGFVVVFVDCRGRFKSEGEWKPFHGHAADGFDVVEWAGVQPWSSGSVGIFGSSGMGVTALQGTVAAPPHLNAAMLLYTGANYFDGWAYSNGVLELGFLMQWLVRTTAPNRVERMAASERQGALRELLLAASSDIGSLVSHLPIGDNPSLPDELAPWLGEWLEHREYDEYWSEVDAAAHAAEIRVPVLHVSGWFDNFLQGHLDLQRALQTHPRREVRDESRMVIGPWTHDSYISLQSTGAGDQDFGPGTDAGAAWMTSTGLEWFERWLNQAPVPTTSTTPPVRYFVIGANEWREAATWPPAHDTLSLYLHSTGSANSRLGDGTLSDAPPTSLEPPDRFEYDPLNPVPSVGGPTLQYIILPPGIQNQSEVELRPDIVVYTTKILDEPLTVAGPISLRLYASTDAVSTDFTAKLVDVRPTGYCANVAEGIVRVASNAAPDATSRALEVLTLDVPMRDVAHTFRAGHRIRLEISSSNFPRFGRNMNSSRHPNDAAASDAVAAAQKVHHSPDCASLLLLPKLANT